MTWKLHAITDELMGQDINIVQDMLVGRHQDADLVLQAAEISRRHAALLLKENQLWVQDLNSSNGTYVNEVRIQHETVLNDRDIVQFASLQFAVIQSVAVDVPVEDIVTSPIEPVIAKSAMIEQPAEAVATSEYLAESMAAAEAQATEAAPTEAAPTEATPTAADLMNNAGMPSLNERVAETVVTAEGMPEQVAIPKPAPIPAGVDLQAKIQPTAEVVPTPESALDQQQENKKNTSVGLITIVALIILAIIAWLFFK